MTYTLTDDQIKNLRALVEDLRTPTPVYLPGEFGNGYEMGRDSANDNTADALTEILPFLRPDPNDISIPPHAFEAFDGATGRTCTRMVLRDGGGDQCGHPPAHPIHHAEEKNHDR